MLNCSELSFVTFLYDENANNKVLLTSEQYLITVKQAEFTSRKFISYVFSKDKQIISEPIQISDIEIQKRHAIENIISNKLGLFQRERSKVFDHLNLLGDRNKFLKIISDECEFINAYIQDRLDQLKIEEKIIEEILPILGKIDY